MPLNALGLFTTTTFIAFHLSLKGICNKQEQALLKQRLALTLLLDKGKMSPKLFPL